MQIGPVGLSEYVSAKAFGETTKVPGGRRALRLSNVLTHAPAWSLDAVGSVSSIGSGEGDDVERNAAVIEA